MALSKGLRLLWKQEPGPSALLEARGRQDCLLLEAGTMAALSKSGRGQRAAFAGHPWVRGSGREARGWAVCGDPAVRGRWPAAPSAPARAVSPPSLLRAPGACSLLAATGAERAPEEGPADGMGLGARSFSPAASAPADRSDVQFTDRQVTAEFGVDDLPEIDVLQSELPVACRARLWVHLVLGAASG